MKERQRHNLNRTLCILPGDKLICSVDDRDTKKTYTFSEDIGRHLEVDTIVTFDVDEPVLGLVDGIGAIFGKAK
jgi:hypothetical protein